MIPYLETLKYKCPKYANPTDFCFEVMRHDDMFQKETRFNQENYKIFLEPRIEKEKEDNLSDLPFQFFKKQNTFLYETQQIIKRGFLNFTRNRLIFKGKFITNSILLVNVKF